MKWFRVLQCYIEETAYYLSSVILFNLIYALRILGVNWKDGKPISKSEFLSFVMAALLTGIGMLFTVYICTRDHSIKNKNTLGKTVEISSYKDITSDNYFSNYSLLVLTGIALPLYDNVIGLVIYLLVVLTVGTIFITQKMYYMNPVLTLLGFHVVHAECKGTGLEEDYYFMFRRGSIHKGQKIKFSNIACRIIRLKEVGQ